MAKVGYYTPIEDYNKDNARVYTRGEGDSFVQVGTGSPRTPRTGIRPLPEGTTPSVVTPEEPTPTPTQYPTPQDTGGYFLNPRTGETLSSAQDLTKLGYIRTATPQDIASGNVGFAEGDKNIVFGEKGIEQYNEEAERLKSVTPREGYYNPKTGKVFEEKQTVKIGKAELTSTPYKVFLDPKTGEPIRDIKKYIEENRIPTVLPSQKKISAEEFGKALKEIQTRDLLNIPQEAFKTVSGKEIFGIQYKRPEYSQEYYKLYPEAGTVSPVTATDIASLYGGYLAISKLGISATAKQVLSYGIGKTALTGYETVKRTYIPEPQTGLGRFGVSYVEGLGLGLLELKSPSIGKSVAKAFLFDLGTETIKDPLGTGKRLVTSPETYGFLLGGATISGGKYAFTRRPIELKFSEPELKKYERDIIGKIEPKELSKLDFTFGEKAEDVKIEQKFLESGEKVGLTEPSPRTTIFISPIEEGIIKTITPKKLPEFGGYLGSPRGRVIELTAPPFFGIINFKGLQRGRVILQQSRQKAIDAYRKQLETLTGIKYKTRARYNFDIFDNSGAGAYIQLENVVKKKKGANLLTEYQAKELLRERRPKKIKYSLVDTEALVSQKLGNQERVLIKGFQEAKPIKDIVLAYGKKGSTEFMTLDVSGGKRALTPFVESLIKEPITKDKTLQTATEITESGKSLYKGTKTLFGRGKPKEITTAYLIERKGLFEKKIPDEESSAFIRKEELSQKSISQDINTKRTFVEQSKSNLLTYQPFKLIEVLKAEPQVKPFEAKLNKRLDVFKLSEAGTRESGTREIFRLIKGKEAEAQPFPFGEGFNEGYQLIKSEKVDFKEKAPTDISIIYRGIKKPKTISYIDKFGNVKESGKLDFLPKFNKKQSRAYRSLGFEEPQIAEPKKKLLQGSGIASKEGQMMLEIAKLLQEQPQIPQTSIVVPKSRSFSIQSPEVFNVQKPSIFLANRIEPQTKIEEKITLEPKIRLEPKVKIESRIESRIDTRLEPEVKVSPRTRIESRVEPKIETRIESRIEPQVKVEPQMRVEPQVRIEPNIMTRPQLKILEPKIRVTKTGKKEGSLIKKVPTYSTEVKRFGEFKPVGTGLSMKEAVSLGETKVKQTLARTFRIKKTGFYETGIDENFSEPNLGEFREYKVRKGKRVPLPSGTFIQKTQFALSSLGEKQEIQLAKQNKLFKGLID